MIARKTFLGLVLRAGGGAKYELRVFPVQRKLQLLARLTRASTEYLAIEKRVAAVKGVGGSNVLRLRAEGIKGKVRIRVFLGPTEVGTATDPSPEINGEFSGISVGAPRYGRCAVATFDAIVVRMPIRF